MKFVALALLALALAGCSRSPSAVGSPGLGFDLDPDPVAYVSADSSADCLVWKDGLAVGQVRTNGRESVYLCLAVADSVSGEPVASEWRNAQGAWRSKIKAGTMNGTATIYGPGLGITVNLALRRR